MNFVVSLNGGHFFARWATRSSSVKSVFPGGGKLFYSSSSYWIRKFSYQARSLWLNDTEHFCVIVEYFVGCLHSEMSSKTDSCCQALCRVIIISSKGTADNTTQCVQTLQLLVWRVMSKTIHSHYALCHVMYVLHSAPSVIITGYQVHKKVRPKLSLSMRRMHAEEVDE